MTIALIIATGRVRGRPGQGPAAALPYRTGPGEPADPPTLLARLCDRLATLNVPDVRVIGRPSGASVLRADGHFVTECADPAADLREIARVARYAEEPVLLLPADLVASDALLERLVHGSGTEAVTVPVTRAGRHGTAGARAAKGRIVAVDTGAGAFTGPDPWTGSAVRVNAAVPGVLRFDPSGAHDVAEIAEDLADRDRDLAAADGTPRGDALVVLLAGLVRAGVPVAARPARDLVCRRAADPDAVAEARAELEWADGEGARLAASVKTDDGFFATFAVSSYSPRIVRWVAARGVTPDTVTGASAALALLAALWFSGGTRVGLVIGAVLLYLAFVLDCVDGQLARYTGRSSALGGWLDAVSDRVKEYAVYAGLAIGSAAAATGTSAHAGDVWGLAVAALVLQTVRHMVDFSYAARDGAPDQDGAVARLSSRTSGVRALHWAKKILVLPIGERFALIALTAAFFDARVTFLALIVWGGVAAVYTLTGRVLRTLEGSPA